MPSPFDQKPASMQVRAGGTNKAVLLQEGELRALDFGRRSGSQVLVLGQCLDWLLSCILGLVEKRSKSVHLNREAIPS